MTYRVADDSLAVQAALSAVGAASLFVPPLGGDEALYAFVRSLRLPRQEPLLINVHLRLFPGAQRSDCLGLRIFDELVLALGAECPPLVLYSPLNAEQLVQWCERRSHTTDTPWFGVGRRVSEASDGRRSIADFLLQVSALTPPHIAQRARAWPAAALQELRERTALDYVEMLHARVRHAYPENIRAAVRLVLGTELAKRPRTTASFKGILEKLGRKSPPPGFTVLTSPAYVEALRHAPAKVSRDALDRARSVLLIDDQAFDAGWAEALRAVFPNWSLTPRVVPEAVDSTLNDYDLVLLDYELKADRTSAEWLRRVKAEHPELPVVMFTSSDRMDIARWCLQHGANAYFVKEPYEPTCRNSAEHLNRFLDVLGVIDSDDPVNMSGMWSKDHPVRKFINVVYRSQWAAVVEAQTVVGRDHAGVTWHLAQLGRALLGRYEDFYLARGATLDRSRVHQVATARLAYHIEVALESLATESWERGRPQVSPEVHARYLQGPPRDWRSRWNFLIKNGYQGLPLVTTDHGTAAGTAASHWRSFIPGTPLPTIRDVLAQVLGPLQNCIESLPAPPPPPEAPLLSPGELQKLESEPQPVRRSGPSGPASHARQQWLGARDLLKGLHELCGPSDADPQFWITACDAWARGRCIPDESELASCLARQTLDSPQLQEVREEFPLPGGGPLRILFVDDQPWSAFVSAFRLALYAVFGGGVETTARTPPEVPATTEALQDYDLVLLDLDHGTSSRPEGDLGGLRWLHGLRTEAGNWGTPVALVSGRIDSLLYSEALQYGAVDYIPKRVSGREPADALRFILEHVLDLGALRDDIRKLRNMEERIRNLWSNPLIRASTAPAPLSLPAHQVEEAIRNALLSSWFYLYLNVTRNARVDVWLDQVFSRSDPEQSYLRQAVVDMGSAIEPLILLAPSFDTGLANSLRSGVPDKAGEILRIRSWTEGKETTVRWHEVATHLDTTLLRTISAYWLARNACEHERSPRFLNQPDPTGYCIAQLDACVSVVDQFRKSIART